VTTPGGQDPWVGRASPPPPRDPWREPTPTLQQPVVPAHLAGSDPPVVYVQAPRRRVGLVVALLLLSFAAGAVIAMAASPSLRDFIGLFPSPSDGPSTTSTPSPTPTTPAPPGIGDPVRDGSFEFVVNDVDCGHDSVTWGILSPSAHGQFCLVSISVKNFGQLAGAFVIAAQHLNDDNGSRHTADSSATYVVNHAIPIWDDVIGAGSTRDGVLVFDIPKHASPVSVELHDSLFSNGVTVTLTP
jgi:hypothetical protein